MTPYADFLRKNIFKTDEFAQFELMFQALAALPLDEATHVAILERSFIYDGQSIFAGLVDAPEVTVIDYRPASASERAGYQAGWLEESGYDFLRSTAAVVDTGTDHELDFDTLDCDILLIPNVLHHCRNFPSLMAKLQSAMPRLKRVFVYDSTLRENHQVPDDFCRYTPAALEDVLRPMGYATETLEETGNIFDAILYFISQAKVPLGAPELASVKALMDDKVVPSLREIRHDLKYRPLGRAYASATTAYAITFARGVV